MSIKLTDTQLVILSAAAQREDRCLILPPTLKGGAAQKVANKLISSGFTKEVRPKAGAPIWRRDEESGEDYALKLTAAGAKAIVADEDVEPDNVDNEGGALENHSQPAVPSETAVQVAPSAEAMEPVAAGPSAPRSGSKLARVIQLLQRDHARGAICAGDPPVSRPFSRGGRSRGWSRTRPKKRLAFGSKESAYVVVRKR